MDCKLIDCDEEATARVVHPYGTVNVCEAHASALGEWEADTAKAMLEVMRYGPREDPPLEDDDRGPAYPEGDFPRFMRWGPVLDVIAAYDGERAWCQCVHGKSWPEGDSYEPEGRACFGCAQAALQAFRETLV